MNGLVIKSPWIERILQTPQTWAIRGISTNIRGRIALIQGRSGQIIGTCEIVDCIGPMTLEELKAEARRQQATVEILTATPGTRTFAWVLAGVKILAGPIPCAHAAGLKMWVKLTPENVPGRYAELEGEISKPQVQVTVMPVVAEIDARSEPASRPEPSKCQAEAQAA